QSVQAGLQRRNRCLQLTELPAKLRQAVKRTDGALPALARPRRNAAIDAARGNVSADAALGQDGRVRADAHPAAHADLSEQHRVVADLRLAGEAAGSADDRARADPRVVADCAQGSDARAIADAGRSRLAGLDHGIGADLHAVTDAHAAGRGELIVFVAGRSGTVRE